MRWRGGEGRGGEGRGGEGRGGEGRGGKGRGGEGRGGEGRGARVQFTSPTSSYFIPEPQNGIVTHLCLHDVLPHSDDQAAIDDDANGGGEGGVDELSQNLQPSAQLIQAVATVCRGWGKGRGLRNKPMRTST